MSINLSTGPSSWDRDMQGMLDTDEEESENLAALGMHITGYDKKNEEEEEDDDELMKMDEGAGEADEEDEDEIDEEEVDELEELDHLARKLKEEESPTLIDEEE